MSNQNTGGSATVDLQVGGSPLKFSGRGYHDASWSSGSFGSFVGAWYFGGGEVGPYRISYLLMTAINSSNPVNIGSLAMDGDIVQQQCSVAGTKQSDFNTVTP